MHGKGPLQPEDNQKERNVEAKKGSSEVTLKLNVIVCFLLISGLLKIVSLFLIEQYLRRSWKCALTDTWSNWNDFMSCVQWPTL